MGKVNQGTRVVWCLSNEQGNTYSLPEQITDSDYTTTTGLDIGNGVRMTRTLGYPDSPNLLEEIRVTPAGNGKFNVGYSGQGPLAAGAFSRRRYSAEFPKPVVALNDLISQAEDLEPGKETIYFETIADAEDVDAILDHLGIVLAEGSESAVSRRLSFSEVLPHAEFPDYLTPEQRCAGDYLFGQDFIPDVYHENSRRNLSGTEETSR